MICELVFIALFYIGLGLVGYIWHVVERSNNKWSGQ